MAIENGSTIRDEANRILVQMLVAGHVRDHAKGKGDAAGIEEAEEAIRLATRELDSLGITTGDRAQVTAARKTAVGLEKGFRRSGHKTPFLAAAEVLTMPAEGVIATFGKRTIVFGSATSGRRGR